MNKIIIFDMDGTLIDSSNSMASSINYVRTHIGLEPLSVEYIKKYSGLPNRELSKVFYDTSDKVDELESLFITHYKENCIKDIELFKGIEQLLDKLSGEYKLAIATNVSDFFARKMLEHLGIMKYFSVIIGANVYYYPKPEPDMINSIMHMLSSSSRNTIMIGDSKRDQMAALNAGVDYIHVEWGFEDANKNYLGVTSTNELSTLITQKFDNQELLVVNS